ncbi:hypothetical protein [Sporosarcina sp. SAFN-015]|uniref:hypothetical protein n=1 Tax=Sporosarcina sp. SAFN-015 TaxID=3387274 RepID=UPI003F7D3CA9
MIRRLFCRHAWMWVGRDWKLSAHVYGCTKCGKAMGVSDSKGLLWRLRREMKGETFDD